MRTGTSMVMRALEAGGMDAAYRQSREVMREHHADEKYDPNVGGLYELERKDYRREGFPRGYEGKLIKALNNAVPRMLPMPGGIRVVFMRRRAEEIDQSYRAFFGKRMGLWSDVQFQQYMDDIVALIRNRRDVLSCHVFWYRQVLDYPLGHFALLARAEWPIDVDTAAAVPDPALCRYKVESLDVGVY